MSFRDVQCTSAAALSLGDDAAKQYLRYESM
jgi:hypothetical protein